MSEKKDINILLEYIPIFTVWKKLLGLYVFQIIIFILLMILFWWISSLLFLGSVIGQLLISSILVIYFIYIANNSEKIKNRYRKRYGKLAGQKFWLNYLSYINPIVSAAFYFPLLLITYEFPPFQLIDIPPHIMSTSLLPIYFSLPIGIIIVIFGLLIRKPSGGYGVDVDSYLYMIFPEKSRLIKNGIYKYIRNPQYLCRGIIAIGFGFIANNINAILVGIIHFLSYCAIIPSEDKELIRRFGGEFKKYKKSVPALFPKYGNWKKFLKIIFVKQ